MIEWGEKQEVQGQFAPTDIDIRVYTHEHALALSLGAEAGPMMLVARSALA